LVRDRERDRDGDRQADCIKKPILRQ
jgi:hypothetical protein